MCVMRVCVERGEGVLLGCVIVLLHYQHPPLGRSAVLPRVNISGRGSAPIHQWCCFTPTRSPRSVTDSPSWPVSGGGWWEGKDTMFRRLLRGRCYERVCCVVMRGCVIDHLLRLP